MNRTLLLVALFLLLGGTAWYALSKKKNQMASHVSWDMEFAVKDPNTIGKIFIADREGHTTTLERKGNGWIYNGKYPARPSLIETLLETISKVTVLNIPPNGAVPGMVKEMASLGIKVEIYDRQGKALKTYYIGGITNDERGTILMMDGSEQPYVAHIPGFIGQFRLRFQQTGNDDWRDKAIFREKPEEIQAVWVEYPQRKNESFKLEKTGEATYDIKPYFSTTTLMKGPRRKGVAEAYLVQFENLVAEAFETGNPAQDSVKNLVPFAILTLKKTDGAEKKVRFWPLQANVTQHGGTYVERYYTDVNNEDFMLTQDRVFGCLFRGYGFFFEGIPEKNRLRN